MTEDEIDLLAALERIAPGARARRTPRTRDDDLLEHQAEENAIFAATDTTGDDIADAAAADDWANRGGTE